MTTQELIDYYVNLLIIQYHGKPKAVATIEALLKPIIMDKLLIEVQNGFDLTTAVGVQLDTLGKYIGVTRDGYGFSGQAISLDDADFKTLLLFAIVSNSSDSSHASIKENLFNAFGSDVQVFDGESMNISYYLDVSLGTEDLIQLLVTQNLLPKPMAVGLASVIYTDIADGFFGYRTYSLAAGASTPFNTYDDYNLTWRWLSYADALL